MTFISCFLLFYLVLMIMVAALLCGLFFYVKKSFDILLRG